MKHLALVPLIGGMALGAEKTLGSPPEAVVSYSAFAQNEAYYTNYMAKRGHLIPRYELDSDDEAPTFSDIDLVTSVCPCSGLSSANRNAGSGCQQNQWMLKSSEYALSNITPRVLIGENASALMGSRGVEVVAQLRDIGLKRGYSLQLVKTNTCLHGIPQTRDRSFFIFWRDSGPYQLKQEKNPHELPWYDFLDSFSTDDSEVPKGNVSLNWLMETTQTLTGLSRDELKSQLVLLNTSIFNFLVRARPDILEALFSQYELSDNLIAAKVVKTLKTVVAKLEEKPGSNFYDTSYYYREIPNFSAVMFRSRIQVLNPKSHRTITDREAMRLMGLPEDMDVPDNPNAIAQNVPTCTAQWITRECIAALNGERDLINEKIGGDEVFRWSNQNGKTAQAIGTKSTINLMKEFIPL